MRLFDILGVLYEPINALDNHEHLLSYIEPKLNEDGTCPIFKEPGRTYNLEQYLTKTDGISEQQQRKHLLDLLARLSRLVRWIHLKTDVFWFGIYLRHGDKLVKYVYNGEMSKAEFDISEEYLERSINTRVIMEKRPYYIADVDNHTGPYYRCDAKVKSELCCPIFAPNGDVIGIFDCEDQRKNFFDDKIDFISLKVRRAIEIFLEDHPYITHCSDFVIEQDEFSKRLDRTNLGGK
ncbi:GAF domain-containing protein [Thalassotalea ponticola]|uniref:GAF domain-containing protein n=1 Tax=Thalassotalea ponticola TaxID=1523392 RepID=UPI0025B48A26|nr:GAF domain-containing protein [Thalassotalea ponticola]MDN3651920.1 GAF domain-containing protein [Thalassotalea ponticola]